jgi:membrane fusion protein, multidrug efflux system
LSLAKKGTLLATIDKKQYMMAVNKAETNVNQAKQDISLAQINVSVALSNIQEAKAKMIFALKTYKRCSILNETKAVSDQQEDQAYGNYSVSKAQLDEAIATLQQRKQVINVAKSELKEAISELNRAKLNLDYTNLYAPNDGYVSDFYLNPGEYVSTGEKLFAFIDSRQWWVEAEFKETDIKRIQTGQKVKVYVDMYDRNITGTVESIGYGSGATYSLLPPENGTGNWVKVTQRFPVRIKISNAKNNLRVGSSVEVTVDTVA